MPNKALILLACFALTGCFTTIPLGNEGQYGSVKIDIQYQPPVNLWQQAPKFLADK